MTAPLPYAGVPIDGWRPMGAKGDGPAVLFPIPVHTKNTSNVRRTNSPIAGILAAKEQRELKATARVHARRALALARVTGASLVPCIVVMARLSSGTLDDDGLAAALKRVRDGIAAELGIDDGSRFVRFRPRQVKAGRGVHGIEIAIWRADLCAMWGDE